MGGNIKVNGHSADKIDVKKYGRWVTVEFIRTALKHIQEQSGLNLFPHDASHYTTGSTQWLFDESIPDEQLLLKKPTFGDLDFMVYDDPRPLADLPAGGVTIPRGAFLGAAKTSMGVSMLIISDALGGTTMQIDLNRASMDETGLPMEWDNFSHSANWNDWGSHGIKGVFHKYLIRAICGADSKYWSVVTRNGIKEEYAGKYSFSVDNGLRERFTPADGGWKRLSAKDAVYDRDVIIIFTKLFWDGAYHQIKRGDVWSFVGLVKMVKEHFPQDMRQNVFELFCDICFGKGAQKVSNDPKEDRALKEAAVFVLSFELRISRSYFYDRLTQDYYDGEFWETKI